MSLNYSAYGEGDPLERSFTIKGDIKLVILLITALLVVSVVVGLADKYSGKLVQNIIAASVLLAGLGVIIKISSKSAKTVLSRRRILRQFSLDNGFSFSEVYPKARERFEGGPFISRCYRLTVQGKTSSGSDFKIVFAEASTARSYSGGQTRTIATTSDLRGFNDSYMPEGFNVVEANGKTFIYSRFALFSKAHLEQFLKCIRVDE